MYSLRTAGLLAAALALAVVSAAVDDTTKVALPEAPSYTFGSNVANYLKLSEDVCEIKTALAAEDWDSARSIYVNGKNVYTTSGNQKTLKGVATASYGGEATFDLFAEYFNTSSFLDKFPMDGLDGIAPFTTVAQRRETAEKGIQNVLQTVYLMHELDEAAEKIEQGKNDATDGAPNNIDETFAIYIGNTLCSPWSTAHKRGLEMGTMQTCTLSQVNSAVTSNMLKARTAASVGDEVAFKAAVTELKRQFLITHLQNAVKYSTLLDQDVAANKPTDENQAEGYAFFRTVEPLVAQADPEAAATIRARLYPGNAVVPNSAAQVRKAVDSAAAKLSITSAEIGEYGAKQNLGCDNGAGSLGSFGAVLALLLALFYAM